MKHRALSRIEGIPVIIRFKTFSTLFNKNLSFLSIEGIPVIIRFKTLLSEFTPSPFKSIEGIPVIIRFKTVKVYQVFVVLHLVLKVFQL